tara:strand:+ start:1021 stop:1383 length:363 start_codon:yes stop_codon:yes gene_type:complete
MPYIDLTFNTNLNNNISTSVGDTVYYTDPTTSGGFTVSSSNVLIGTIESISSTDTTTTIKVDCELDLVPPTSSSFIFFSKNNAIHSSSIKGYYSLIEFKNNSTSPIELFSVGCDVAESSK